MTPVIPAKARIQALVKAPTEAPVIRLRRIQAPAKARTPTRADRDVRPYITWHRENDVGGDD